MFGGWEWVIIIVVVLLLFGARRLPEAGRSLGRGIRAFRKELRGEPDEAEQDRSDAEDAPKSSS